jgi:hypothetical protein
MIRGDRRKSKDCLTISGGRVNDEEMAVMALEQCGFKADLS